MWIPSVLAALWKSRSSQPQLRSRLQLEALEDRLVPAIFIWDGGGSDNNWTTAANWDGNQVPGVGADLVFPVNAQRKTNNNDLPAGRNIGSITFEGDGYNLSGNLIDLRRSGTIINATNSTGSNTINFQINMGEPINPAEGRFIQVVSAQAELILNGKLSGGLLDFRTGGSGRLVLAGSNDFGSTAELLGPAVRLRNSSALGKVTNFAGVFSGSDVRGKGIELENGITVGEPLVFRQTTLRNVSGNNSLTGLFQVSDPLQIRVEVGSQLTVTQGVTGDDGRVADTFTGEPQQTAINKTGPGTLIFSGNGTYTGPTTVSEGVLHINGSSSL